MNEFARYGVTEAAERRIAFFLSGHFDMLPFVSVLEPLRVANRLSGRSLYAWDLVSLAGGTVRASNGLAQTATVSLKETGQYRVVVVCGPHDPHGWNEPSLFAWLRAQASRGAMIGAVDTGPFLLARARLLDGHRCTVHWENLDAFVREFPRLHVSGELYEFDQTRFTCAGGTAGIDVMLRLIQTQHDSRLASAVSEVFLHDVIRPPQAPQRMATGVRTGVMHEGLVRCIERMQQTIEQPLLPAQLALEAGVSKRQLERLFRRWLQTTPSRYYMELRLNLARTLLSQTGQSVTDIALACGFTAPGHFSERFRVSAGISPRGFRRSAQRRVQPADRDDEGSDPPAVAV